VIGNLDETIETLLKDALPALLTGPSRAVDLRVIGSSFEIDPQSADNLASEPKPDDRTDDFAFDPASLPPSFTLSQTPYAGPRRVRLTTGDGDRLPLSDDEVIWDQVDRRVFSMSLRPTRDLTGVTGVQVLYSVTAVFTTLKAAHVIAVELDSTDEVELERAEALVVGVIELNRPALVDGATQTFADGDYSATVTAKSLKLIEGTAVTDQLRRLTYHAEVEVKAIRVLGEDEGGPIVRIRTTSQPLDPSRSVDVRIDVEA